jgi:predicted RNase H-like HicB family nuclease
MHKYVVVVEKADGNFSAFSPDVPGCISTGATVEETVQEMKSALAFHLEEEGELPVAKGLEKHLDEGVFGEGLAPEYYITEVEVPAPQHLS